MALFGIAPASMKSSALILNLFVSGIAFISFYKAKYFKFRLLWPFVITSMPAAYLGAQISINPAVYKIILGICLLFAVARILYKPKNSESEKNREIPIFVALIIGAALGIFSGMIGIGGGIILSPLLIVLNWSSVKEAAAVSAPFIFLNSFSGLIGLMQQGFTPQPDTVMWITGAMAGGLIGSYLGSYKFSMTGLRYVLATVLSFAAFKLFMV
jgi:uncharacterized membrane protein YfcA